MKVSLNLGKNNAEIQKQNIAFGGFKVVKSEDGFKEVEFAYPYDEDKEDCYLELFRLDKDSYNNYFQQVKFIQKRVLTVTKCHRVQIVLIWQELTV